jgi:molybdopterin converting factor small subunit
MVAAQGVIDKRRGEIELRLYTNLARYGGEKTGFFPVAVSSSETLGGLIKKFGIPREEISMVLVNDRLTGDFETPVHPGDRVKIFGLVGGG